MKIRKAIAIASLGLLLPLTACSALVAEGGSETRTSTTENNASDSTTETDTAEDVTVEPPAGAPAGREGGLGGVDATSTATSTDDLDSLIEQPWAMPVSATTVITSRSRPSWTRCFGITHQELHVRMDAGQNLAAVATDLGIDPQTLIDALVADFQPVIDWPLAEGIITEDQAADYTEQLEEAFTFGWRPNTADSYATTRPCPHPRSHDLDRPHLATQPQTRSMTEFTDGL